jgi:hypothetical protein
MIGSSSSSPAFFTAPHICHVSNTPLSGGIYNRNRTRCGALKFNGWDPDDQTLGTLDYSDVSKAKGIFQFGLYASPSIYDRAKWGGVESRYKYDEIKKPGNVWYEAGDQYLVKHFKSISGDLVDVKFYLKVKFQYYGLRLLPHPELILARRPALGKGYFNELPPWSITNKALSSAEWLRYLATDVVWDPQQNKYVPTKDYWSKTTITYEPGSGTSYAEDVLEKQYSDRGTYIPQISSGFTPWNARTVNNQYKPPTTDYFKETGRDIDSSECVSDPYIGYTEGEWYDWYYGIMCRDSGSTDPYDFPDDKFPFISLDASYSLSAYLPEDNTLCYNWVARKMKIEVWAKVEDTCRICYFKDVNYELSIGYKDGTCKLEASGNEDPKIVLDLMNDNTESFSVTIPAPQNRFETDILVHTIDWEPNPGQAMRITDFKLNSAT